ncbi:MAG: ABC transporter ATP-binding protein [Verrucomicrobiota bacterium]
MVKEGHIPVGTEVGCGQTHALRVQNLNVYYGDFCALSGVNFEIRCGKALALLGRNGAGKSSLLKAIAGLQSQLDGQILWKDQSMAKANYEIAYLPQREEIDWNFPITIRGLVETGRYPQLGLWRRFRAHDAAVVDFAIESMRLQDLQSRQLRQLSGGQQQRAFIARALAQEAHVLLLDEPFAGLDRPSSESLTELLGQLTAEGRLIIASHHDLRTVEDSFDYALLLNRDQVAFGPVSEAFTEERIRIAFAA